MIYWLKDLSIYWSIYFKEIKTNLKVDLDIYGYMCGYLNFEKSVPTNQSGTQSHKLYKNITKSKLMKAVHDLDWYQVNLKKVNRLMGCFEQYPRGMSEVRELTFGGYVAESTKAKTAKSEIARIHGYIICLQSNLESLGGEVAKEMSGW